MAVTIEPRGWWVLIFAALATLVVGSGMRRIIGSARLIAIAGAWTATSVMIAYGEAVWPCVFAFLTTAAVAALPIRNSSLFPGITVAAVWLASALIVVDQQAGAGVTVFAFLTAATLAAGRFGALRNTLVLALWAAATAIILAVDGMYWLSAVAWLLGAIPLGLPRAFPRTIEWDILERGDRRGRDYL